MLRLTVAVMTFSLWVSFGQGELMEMTEAAKQAYVDVHNSERELLGAPKVSWNESLAEFAATQTAVVDCNFVHTKMKAKIGENLFFRWPIINDAEALAKKSVQHWIDEKDDYPGQDLKSNWLALCFPKPKPKGFKDCGHYTQTVWGTSTTIGCAAFRCDKVNMVVCNYWPSGNRKGRDAW